MTQSAAIKHDKLASFISSSYESYVSPTSPRQRRQTVSQSQAEISPRSPSDSLMGHHPSHNTSSPLPRLKLNGSAELGALEDNVPRIWGIPLKYISLVTLAVQNASLTIIMHYSRVSTLPSQAYSAASAVLLNELLKGLISLTIAFCRLDEHGPHHHSPQPKQRLHWMRPQIFALRCRRLGREIFSPDCWKLSIPAILYVIQNNLQFVAASNLDAATFQVSYQMKILTTAAFSVALLRKRLNITKWMALFALALGVGIVQIQSGSGNGHAAQRVHEMHPLIGFTAVTAACFTSGLAGVYFEMVLKGSQADLWVRNVQLSLFSLLPALLPILASSSQDGTAGLSLSSIFANFGGWAWATVVTQVFGGLITALVIKYSDNILKAFATSISIVLSFVASIILFNFRVMPSFLIGASTVLAATWLYNQPDDRLRLASNINGVRVTQLPKLVAGVMSPRKSSFPGTPIEPAEPDAPILGEMDEKEFSNSGVGGVSPSMLSAALKLVTPRSSLENLAGHNDILDEVSLYSAGMGVETGSRPGSVASLSEYQTRYVSRSHSSSPVPGPVPVPASSNGPLPPPPYSRMHSTSSNLSVPTASPRISPSPSLNGNANGQLHPNPYVSRSPSPFLSDDGKLSVVSLDESPGWSTR